MAQFEVYKAPTNLNFHRSGVYDVYALLLVEGIQYMPHEACASLK